MQTRAKNFLTYVAILILSVFSNSLAHALERNFRTPSNLNASLFDHSEWDRILKQYTVADGPITQVKYGTIKNRPDQLLSYLTRLSSVPQDKFAQYSEAEKLAFLINAYNAFTVKLIVDHYPVKSIRDIGGLFSNPWKITFFTLLGEPHALDDIEHEMIRKHFNDPRIHFALVCASRGCPALRTEAYVANRLDSQLEDAARAFLNDGSRNYFDSAQSKLYLSSIFKWYQDDFKKASGTVPSFVVRYMNLSPQEKSQATSPTTRLNFLDYDWSLNDVHSDFEAQTGQMNTEMNRRSKRQSAMSIYARQTPARSPAQTLEQDAASYPTGVSTPSGSSTENDLDSPSHTPFHPLPNRQIAGSATEFINTVRTSGRSPASSQFERWIFQDKGSKALQEPQIEYNSLSWGSDTEYGSSTEKGSTTESSSIVGH